MSTEDVHYQREKLYWDDKGADDYATLSPYDRRRIASWIEWEGDGCILDVGGGSGMVSRLLQEKPGTEIVCLDISHAMLRHSPVPALQADAMQLPLASESFDVVVAAGVVRPRIEPPIGGPVGVRGRRGRCPRPSGCRRASLPLHRPTRACA